jgi:hypothetical protein
MLARRKAALERAASRVAEQRRAAEQAEAERLRQEAAFDELAADFELAVEDEQSVAAKVEEEVRLVRERGQVRIDAARVAAARVVLAMGEAGETVTGCGHRLGVGVERVKELRRLGREALAGEGAGTAPDKTAAAPQKAAASGGGQRDGVRAAGPAGAGPVVAPVAAPPVAPPPAPPVAAPTAPAAPPAGPLQMPGLVGGGGARPGWPESSR